MKMKPQALAFALALALLIALPACGPAPSTTPTAATGLTTTGAPPTSTSVPPPTTTSVPPASTTAPPTSTPPASGAYSVTAQNFTFTPGLLAVPVGATVAWVNRDSDDHTATSDRTGGFDLYLSPSGGTASFTFNTPGQYPYHCSFHSEMTGTVIVG